MGHTSSCAIMPPMLIPIMCSCLSSVQPRWSSTSKVSIAISDVEYLIHGLSDSPMPRLSRIKHVYLEAWSCPKSLVWRCHAVLKEPKPMIHCEWGDFGFSAGNEQNKNLNDTIKRKVKGATSC